MKRLIPLVGMVALAAVLAGCAKDEGPAAPPGESSSPSVPAVPDARAVPEKPSESEAPPAPREPEKPAHGGNAASSTASKEPAPTTGESAPGGKAPDEADAGKSPEIQAAYWLNTEPLTLESQRGKVVVLEFWATWCPPCRASIPHLNELFKKYKDQGVTFISLTNEPRETVEPFVKQMEMAYPIGGGSPSGRAYKVRGIPHVFVIDRSGKVAWEGHPMQNLEEVIQKQLQAEPAK